MNESTTTEKNLHQQQESTYRDLWSRPGYLIRRLHQIHIGLFADECGQEDITAIQFGILSVLYNGDELDQLSLSTAIGIDRVSGGDVVKRLARRGLLSREPSEKDRRAHAIKITDEGKAFVDRMFPAMVRAQEKFINPLTKREQAQFTYLVRKMIEANNGASRAPLG